MTVQTRKPRARGGRPARHVALFLLVGMILISGSPLLFEARIAAVLALLAVVAATHPGLDSAEGYGWRCTALVGLLTAVVVAQRFSLGFVSWPASMFVMAKVVASGFVIWRVGKHFVPGLLNATCLLCILSLPAYAMLLITGPQTFPTFFPESIVGENLKSIVVLTVHLTPEWWRNSGPLWEPGAFQGIINLTLLLTPSEVLLRRKHAWKVVVLLVTLVTTFSTTGYIAVFLVLLYKVLRTRRFGMLKVPLVAMVVSVAIYTYIEADFLGEKIAQQAANIEIQEDFTPDRFGALIFDLHYIQKSPWIGNGLHQSTRFADHPHLQGEALGHGNGLSNYIASMGLVSLGGYLALLCMARTGWNHLDRISVCGILLLLVFGEQFLLLPLFLGLPFIRTKELVRPVRRRRRAAAPTLPTAELQGSP